MVEEMHESVMLHPVLVSWDTEFLWEFTSGGNIKIWSELGKVNLSNFFAWIAVSHNVNYILDFTNFRNVLDKYFVNHKYYFEHLFYVYDELL